MAHELTKTIACQSDAEEASAEDMAEQYRVCVRRSCKHSAY